jgi:hypothetical protein
VLHTAGSAKPPLAATLQVQAGYSRMV